MNIEMILSVLILSVPLYAFVQNRINTIFDWRKTIKVISYYFIAGLAFWFFRPQVENLIANIGTDIISQSAGNSAALWLARIEIMLIFGLGYYGINRWLINKGSGVQRIVLALVSVIGATACMYLYVESWASIANHRNIFIFQAGVIIVIGLLVFWKSDFQERYMISSGYVILNIVGFFGYGVIFGVNLVSVGFINDFFRVNNPVLYIFVALNVIFGLYAVIWDKGEENFKRTAYKVQYVIAFSMMVFLLFCTVVAFVGGFNGHESDLKAAINEGKIRELNLKGVEIKKTPVNGLTYDGALQIIRDPSATSSDLAKANDTLEKMKGELAPIVAAKEAATPVWNNAKVDWLLSKAGKLLPNSWSEPKKQLVWTKVPGSEREITGKGLGEKDDIPIDLNGIILPGDKLVFKCEEFQQYNNVWKTHRNELIDYNKNTTPGGIFGVKVPKNKRLIFWLEREVPINKIG